MIRASDVVSYRVLSGYAKTHIYVAVRDPGTKRLILRTVCPDKVHSLVFPLGESSASWKREQLAHKWLADASQAITEAERHEKELCVKCKNAALRLLKEQGRLYVSAALHCRHTKAEVRRGADGRRHVVCARCGALRVITIRWVLPEGKEV